jgi:hypothetical protein
MVKEEEKEKKEDKSKSKEKKEKEEKSKDKKEDKKDKDKKEEKSKDKKEDKKDKDKKEDKKDKEKKEKKEEMGDQSWKLDISQNLDNLIVAYEQIANKFKDIDNYILKNATSREDFIEKVKQSIKDMSEASQEVFVAFLDAI